VVIGAKGARGGRSARADRHDRCDLRADDATGVDQNDLRCAREMNAMKDHRPW
jgi:hypothetical protein